MKLNTHAYFKYMWAFWQYLLIRYVTVIHLYIQDSWVIEETVPIWLQKSNNTRWSTALDEWQLVHREIRSRFKEEIFFFIILSYIFFNMMLNTNIYFIYIYICIYKVVHLNRTSWIFHLFLIIKKIFQMKVKWFRGRHILTFFF